MGGGTLGSLETWVAGTGRRTLAAGCHFLCSYIHIPFKCLCGEFHSTENIQTMQETLTKQSSREPKIKALLRPGQLTRAMLPPASTGSKMKLYYHRKHLWRSMRGWPRTFNSWNCLHMQLASIYILLLHSNFASFIAFQRFQQEISIFFSGLQTASMQTP